MKHKTAVWNESSSNTNVFHTQEKQTIPRGRKTVELPPPPEGLVRHLVSSEKTSDGLCIVRKPSYLENIRWKLAELGQSPWFMSVVICRRAICSPCQDRKYNGNCLVLDRSAGDQNELSDVTRAIIRLPETSRISTSSIIACGR